MCVVCVACVVNVVECYCACDVGAVCMLVCGVIVVCVCLS